jgi:hypothetical protein
VAMTASCTRCGDVIGDANDRALVAAHARSCREGWVREHLTIRVAPGAREHAAYEAAQESQRVGVRVSRSEVLRAWLALGRAAWIEGKRP